jgi:ABC-2 type transport system ATP-binding protein
MTEVIRADHLTKVYTLGMFARRRVQALNDFSLTVKEGEVFGLIGPNGAGKSTSIKILLNLIQPTAGSASLFGIDVRDKRARTQLGFVPENPAPHEYLSAEEYVQLQAVLAGRSTADAKVLSAKALDAVELGALRKVIIRRYSKGMVQRTMLAGAIVANPRLLILDEPTSGLDPLGRRLVRDLILQQRKAGVTVLFCTHIISDVESLCDRVALLARGQVVRAGAIVDIVKSSDATVEMICEGSTAEGVRGKLEGLSATVETSSHLLLVRLPESHLQTAIQRLVGEVQIRRIQPHRFGLEDAFMSAVQGAAGDSVGGVLQ